MLITFIARRAELAGDFGRGVASLAQAARRAAAWCALGWARAQQRRALRELDAQQLRDIGLTAGEALREAEKPFWRP
jgi:uncharacterized protein YjiS (DUF1127 family)